MKNILFLFLLLFSGVALAQTQGQVLTNKQRAAIGVMISDSLDAVRTLIGAGGTASIIIGDSLDNRFGPYLDMEDLREVQSYEPVMQDSSIILYNNAAWSIFDLGNTLSNFSVKSASETITGSKIFSNNKTVFGTTTNDSVGIRGNLDVDGNATIGASTFSNTTLRFRLNGTTTNRMFAGPVSNYWRDNLGGLSLIQQYSDGYNVYQFGDIDGIGNGTFLEITDQISRVDFIADSVIITGDLKVYGNIYKNGILLNGSTVGDADSLGSLPASDYVTKAGINGWSTNLYTSSANEMRLGKSYNNKRFNNGAYSDVWNIDYVVPPYNLSAGWLFPIEHRADYYNDTLQTVSGIANILKIDGIGTSIWKANTVTIAGQETQVNVGDLPDSITLNYSASSTIGNNVIIGEENKTASERRFPMQVKGYNFRIGTNNNYTFPKLYSYYSDLSTGDIEDGYHFYGNGDYPSYFGGNIYTDGYLKVQDSIIIGTSTVKIYPDSVLVGGVRLAKITEAGSLDTSIVNALIEANEDSSGSAIIGTTETLDSIITAYWNDALGGSTIDTAIVNALIEANEDSSGSAIIGTTETLDSLITDYWNDNLGGGTWDSTYAYQRIVSLEASVSSLEDSISSFRAILNSILTALDTCGCSANLSDNTPTAPPTSLVAHGGEYETQMRITWTDPTAGDLDSIRIYRHTSNDSTGAVWIASVAENIETYTNTGLTANTTYWYWAKALDDSSNLSYFSNSDSGKTLVTATADTGFYMLDAEDGVGMLTITGGGITASTDIAYAGTHSYKIAGLGGTTRTYADFDFPVANQDTIWVTYRIYIPTGTAVADGGWNYASLLLSGGDANGDNGEFGLNSSTDVDGWQKPFGTLVNTNFSTGAWHKIEVMYIQGTGANARDYCYVDEDLVYSTNTGAGTVDTDGFRFGAYNWTMAIGEAIYFDNIIFSTTRLPLD